MKTEIGLWIDHRKAVIVTISDKGQVTREIDSHVDKQARRTEGVSSTARHESHPVPADDRREGSFTAHLSGYYDEVITSVRDASSILICGPGEAKGELKKRLEKHRPDARIVVVETVDKMTDRQIAAKVREYFHK